MKTIRINKNKDWWIHTRLVYCSNMPLYRFIATIPGWDEVRMDYRHEKFVFYLNKDLEQLAKKKMRENEKSIIYRMFFKGGLSNND